MGSALLILLPVASADNPDRDACPTDEDRLALVAAAERSLVEADLAGVQPKLRELEAALGCGSVAPPELLARMWLAEGAALSLAQDPAAAESWKAAHRLAPEAWTSSFGESLRRAFDAAVAAPAGPATAPLSVDPAPVRWVAAVDGQPVRRWPLQVAPGLHLVQVGATVDDVRFARIVVALPDTPVVVVTGLEEPTDGSGDPSAAAGGPSSGPDRPPKEPKPPLEPAPAALHLGVGGTLGLGRPDDTSAEPAVKLVLPVETGVVLRPVDLAWVRVALRAGPLVGGSFSYSDAWGETTSPTSLGGYVAGGLAGPQGDLGLLVGYHWPERVAFRGTVGVATGRFPASVEGRLGLDAPLGAAPETAFDLVLAFHPRIVRGRPEDEG